MSSDATRRQFLREVGLLSTGVLTMAQTASASHLDEPGENIDLVYDQSMLNKYRPRLAFPTEAREKLMSVRGWVAKSPDYDTDVCCYWVEYTHQEGWLGKLDSHDGDHEPIHVEVNSDTGDVERVRASIWHWKKGEFMPSSEALYEETHPHFRVLEPHHQFTAVGPHEDGTFIEVDNLHDKFSSWLKNGLEDALYPGSTTVPWRLRNRSHWWKDTAAGVSVNASIVSAAANLPGNTMGSIEP